MPVEPTPVRRRGKRKERRLFQIGDFWLGHEAGSDYLFYYWYDSETGRTRRKSTGLRDLEEAKLFLAKLVLVEPPADPIHPDLVPLATVRRFYWEHHGKKIRSANAAKRAFKLVSSYLSKAEPEGAPKVGQFSLALQHGFMKWCRDEHGLSAKSISTYLSYIKAALKFAATPRLVTDARGRERVVCILSSVPHIVDGEEAVSVITALPRSRPRHWIPTDAELASFIDQVQHEHVFRYIIMALNTWARPEAIIEMDVSAQVDFERGLLHLNPLGRLQNKKVRPTIRLTENLRGWLLHWNLNRPIVMDNLPVQRVDNRTFAKAAERAGIGEQFTKYTLRHYMATRARSVPSIPVAREERAEWLGHTDPNHRTTQTWYESLDPDYLLSCARATDAIMLRLDQLCRRSLVAPNVDRRTGFVVISRSGDESAAM